MPPMLKIGHVTIAGRDLARLSELFAQRGIAPDHGGVHSNGITHMSLLGFRDGSYIELIAALRSDEPSPWWRRHIECAAGPCGWAVEVQDVSAESQRLLELGIGVRGPVSMTRTRADGRVVEWDLAFVGEGEPGTQLPFIIRDGTPRDWRVAPSASVRDGPLTGVARVVVCVEDLETSASLFQRA